MQSSLLAKITPQDIDFMVKRVLKHDHFFDLNRPILTIEDVREETSHDKTAVYNLLPSKSKLHLLNKM